ncbi:hypothetical protein FH972_005453 [Carpinus fangiana]|uniref:Uncharacterized protein n=1 Tax=Carpinus fangiana TaxID=176857 RepID=A0A5N6QPB9_9ROSI|nr:hypothetical protein FH972_005453 [Carpinus fangiana]
MVKKRRGAAEDEVESSEVGEPADPGEVADAVVAAVAEEDEEVESVEERNEVVGSREFCRDIKSKASRLEPVSRFVAICCSGCREQKGSTALLGGERGTAVPEKRVLSVY